MRPVIGVTSQKSLLDSTGEEFVGVKPEYALAIEEGGGAPFLIPLSSEPTVIDSLLEIADGILIPGGEDVSPGLYGENPHPSVTKISAERDTLELRCVRTAERMKKPLFGICRGLQLMNVAFGGTLIQDIASLRGDAQPHRLSGRDMDEGELMHDCEVVPDSRLGRALSTNRLKVNSTHHQAADRVAPGFRVVARAKDGVIEAIERSDDWFALGVQCHPEMLWQSVDLRWREVFRLFVRAAATYRDSRK